MNRCIFLLRNKNTPSIRSFFSWIISKDYDRFSFMLSIYKSKEFIKLIHNDTRNSWHFVFSCFFNWTPVITERLVGIHDCSTGRVVYYLENSWSILVNFSRNHYAFVIFGLNSFGSHFISNDIIDLETKTFNNITYIIADIIVVCNETWGTIRHPKII